MRILTDVGKVLLKYEARTDILKEIARSYSKDERVAYEIFPAARDAEDENHEDVYQLLDAGTLPLLEVWNQFLALTDISQGELDYGLFHSYWVHHLKPIQPVTKVLRSLQDRYPLIAVSNGDLEGYRFWRMLLVGKHRMRFEKIFCSGEQKCRKPTLLNRAVRYLHEQGIDHRTCVYIDDLARNNEAAEALGLKTIQFDGTKHSADMLRRDLERLGFK